VNAPTPPGSTAVVTPNVLRADRPVLEVHAKPLAILFMALFTPGIAGLYLGAVWDAWQRADTGAGERLIPVLIFVILGPIFGAMFLTGVLWLWRVWNGIPFLLVDRRGLVWGRDRDRDIALAWSEIDHIETRRIYYRGYRDRLLHVVPKDPDALARYPRLKRIASWLAGGMEGNLVVSTSGMTVSFDDLVAEIRRHFPGPIDLGDQA
jgi:hypothetical protein